MAATLADAILGSLTVKQMTDGRFAYNAQPVEGLDASGLDVVQYYGGNAEPRWTGTSRDLGGVFTTLSPTAGLSIASGTITVPHRVRSNQGTFAGSSSHPTVSAADALVVPRTVTISRDEGATVNLECFFRSTDGDDPITFATGQTINADAHNARWHLGPVSENGNTIGEVTQVEIDFGIEVLVERFQKNFPERVYIQRRRPTFAITFEDFAAAANFAAAHTVMTAAIVYARKRSGATFVADGTAQHVKFSFADGIEQWDSLGATQGENGTGIVTLFGETLTVAAASAIT